MMQRRLVSWLCADFPKLMAFELRQGACQAFSRPQPRSANLQEVPQVAAFAKSSVERGIATEDFQELLQVCRWQVLKNAIRSDC